MTFDEYTASLKQRFAGKDPRRLAGKKTGRVVLVLKENGAPRRATLTIDGKAATIVEGARTDGDAPIAYVFAALEDWIAFFEHAMRERMERIQFFGDARVLALIPELAAQHQSPIFARIANAT